jgi:hypothetical protein
MLSPTNTPSIVKALLLQKCKGLQLLKRCDHVFLYSSSSSSIVSNLHGPINKRSQSLPSIHNHSFLFSC